MERLQPIGFWSYARQDDEIGGGRLSDLRFKLKNELQQIYGKRQIAIFQDVAAIPPGAEWEKAIDEAIERATFFIPILTPAFVESEWCCREVKKFLEREKSLNEQYPQLMERSRLFPIRYIDYSNAEPFDIEVIKALDARQQTNFTDLRMRSDTDAQVLDRLASIAQEMAQLLWIRVPRALTPAERAAEEEAMRKQQEDARLVAEANERARQEQEEARIAAEEAEEDARREQEALERQRRAAEEAAAAEQRRKAQIAEQQRQEEIRKRQQAEEEERERRRAATANWLRDNKPLVIGGVVILLALIITVILLNREPAPTPIVPTPVNSSNGSEGGGNEADPVLADAPSWVEGKWARADAADGCKSSPIVITLMKSSKSISLINPATNAGQTAEYSFDPATPDSFTTGQFTYARTSDTEFSLTPKDSSTGMTSARMVKCGS
jgi:hypothetical protein